MDWPIEANNSHKHIKSEQIFFFNRIHQVHRISEPNTFSSKLNVLKSSVFKMFDQNPRYLSIIHFSTCWNLVVFHLHHVSQYVVVSIYSLFIQILKIVWCENFTHCFNPSYSVYDFLVYPDTLSKFIDLIQVYFIQMHLAASSTTYFFRYQQSKIYYWKKSNIYSDWHFWVHTGLVSLLCIAISHILNFFQIFYFFNIWHSYHKSSV